MDTADTHRRKPSLARRTYQAGSVFQKGKSRSDQWDLKARAYLRFWKDVPGETHPRREYAALGVCRTRLTENQPVEVLSDQQLKLVLRRPSELAALIGSWADSECRGSGNNAANNVARATHLYTQSASNRRPVIYSPGSPAQLTWSFQSTNGPCGFSRHAHTCSSKNDGMVNRFGASTNVKTWPSRTGGAE